MNRENLNHLIDALWSEHWEFAADDDSVNLRDCNNSAGCIGGHVLALQGRTHAMSLADDVEDFLEIASIPAEKLFEAYDANGKVLYLGNVTRQDAIQALQKLRDTGIVDWSHADAYEKS